MVAHQFTVRLFAAEPRWTYPLCVAVFDMVRDWRVLRAGPMFFLLVYAARSLFASTVFPLLISFYMFGILIGAWVFGLIG